MLKRLPTLLIGLLCLSHAWALSPSLLYDGNAAPPSQGWQASQQTPLTVTVGDGANGVDAGTTRFTTTTNVGARTGGQNMYRYSVGTANLITSIRLKALSVSPHNPLDSALMFSVTDDFQFPFGNSTNRSTMLYIDSATIGWGDDSNGTAAFNSIDGNFHEYAISYHNGQLKVYVDQNWADIAAGTAAPVLARSFVTANTTSAMIVFGDQTNDPNVDSNYVVDYVRFQNLDLPDPPANLTATPGDGTVQISFIPPVDTGSSPITLYTVTATGPGNTPAGSCTPVPALPAVGQTATCTITGLTNGTMYTFSVSATNASGAGPAATVAVSASARPVAIPALGPWSIALLVGLMGALGAWRSRRKQAWLHERIAP